MCMCACVWVCTRIGLYVYVCMCINQSVDHCVEWASVLLCITLCVSTIEDTPNIGHNGFNLSIKDNFCDPTGTWHYNKG